MRKPLKIGLIIVGVLAALVIVAAIVLPIVVEPNQYKGRIAQEVQKATGREFAILGDIDLSVFPWLGLEIGEIRLANAQGFGEEPMAALQNVQVRVKLLPLLSRKVEMDRIIIQDPVIRLAVNEQGRTNWQDILEHMESQAKPEEQPAEPEQPTEPGRSPLESVEIEGLEIENGLLVWDDMQAKARYELRELNVDVGALSMQAQAQPFPVSVDCAFTASEPQASGTLGLDSVVTLMLDQQTARAERTTIKLAIDKLVQQAEGATQSVAGKLAMSADAVTNWEQGVAEVSNLKYTSDLRVAMEQAVDGGRSAMNVAAQSAASADAVVRWIEGLAQVNSLAFTTDYTLEMSDSSAQPAAPQTVAGRVELAGDIDARLNDGVATLRDTRLNTSYRLSTPGQDGAQTLDGKTALSVDAQVNWVKSLAELSGLKVNTSFTLDGAGPQATPAQTSGQGGGQIAGTAALNTEALVNWSEGLARMTGLDLTANLSGAALPSGKADLAFATPNLTANWVQGSLDIPRYTAKAYIVELMGSLTGANLLDKPNLRGSLAVAPFNPGRLAEILTGQPVATKDPKALEQASAKLAFNATQDSLAIRDLEARLDETVLTGSSRVQGFESPRVAFNLAANRFNLDRYLPPAPEAETEAEQPAPAPAPEETTPAPAEDDMLRRLVLNGKARVGELVAYNVRASDVNMTVTARDGVFQVKPLTARMYQGNVNASLRAALQDDGIRKPAFDLNVKGFNTGAFLSDFTALGTFLSGTTDLNLALVSEGVSTKQLLQTLDGKGSFAVINGALKGFNLMPNNVLGLVGPLPDQLTSALSGQLGDIATSAVSFDPANATSFQRFAGSFLVEDGIVALQDSLMRTAQARIGFDGQINLAQEEIVLGLDMLSEQFKKNPKLKNLPIDNIPLTLAGSYDGLRLGVDAKGLQANLVQAAQGAARKEIEQKLGKTLEKELGGKLPGGLGDMLGGQKKPATPDAKPKPGTPGGQDAGKDLGKAIEEGLGGLFGVGKQ